MDEKFFKDAMAHVGIPVIVIDENTDFSKLGNPFEAKPEPEEDWEDRTRNVDFYTVAIFLTDRAYGGPEEGGWWYDCGERIDDRTVHGLMNIPALAYSEEQADLIAAVANETLDATLNKQRRSDVSSVLSEGRYRAMVFDGYPPAFFPETTPRYE